MINGDVLDILVQSRRNRRAALRFFRKLLKRHGSVPRRLITDKLRSYPAAQLQRFASVHGVVQNLFRVGRDLLRAAHHRVARTRAFDEWQTVTCAY